MLYAFGILIIIGAIYEACYNIRAASFRNNLRLLLANAHISNAVISHKFPKILPEPVASYLKKATPKNKPVISFLFIHHKGYFKTAINKPWTAINGKEYFTVNPPGLLWQGITSQFSAVDFYFKGKGKLSVWLFAAIKLFNKKGTTIDQAELIRWVGESILFPSSLFPSEHVHWQAIDDTTALLLYTTDNKEPLSFIVSFNSHHEVETIETKRFMGNRMERWMGTFKNYKSIEGYWVPTLLEAIWIIDGIQYPYAKCNIEKFEINH